MQDPAMNSDDQFASDRRSAFLAALTPDALQQEDRLPVTIRSMNASARSRLQKVYRVADDLFKVREEFVACGRGCSSCCHMNVMVSAIEAQRMAKASGRALRTVPRSIVHRPGEFSGTACPFLGSDGACTVYEDRPLACRMHASFYRDAARCAIEVMDVVPAQMVNYSGLSEALHAIGEGGAPAVMADIRDFFPTPTTAGTSSEVPALGR